MTSLDLAEVRDRLQAAIGEDLGSGDITSVALVPAGAMSVGEFRAKAPLVVCGLAVAEEVFHLLDPAVAFQPVSSDGSLVEAGDVLARVRGNARTILAAERTALNFLQRLSGIATVTRDYVMRVDGTHARILDTRKTAPGLRLLDKYAVACGGGLNHRIGLFDAILIKNNHLAFHANIAGAVRAARVAVGGSVPIEVEVSDLAELTEAVESNPDRILLDNFRVEDTRRAVTIVGGRIPLESSGGINLSNVGHFAAAGVDFVSVGALTHSVAAADIHLLVKPV